MKKQKKKPNLSETIYFVMSILSLCIVLAGSTAAYAKQFASPQTDKISTFSARGTFGNINLMTKDEFTALPGIGNTLADRIIRYRDKYGFFESPEQIKNVKGIGEGKFRKIKDIIYTER